MKSVNSRSRGISVAFNSRVFFACICICLTWYTNIILTTSNNLQEDDSDFQLEIDSMPDSSIGKECPKRIHLVVISDREKSDYPLKALVNSILNHTSTPITLNVVTTKNIEFLDKVNSNFFRVNYHNPAPLLEKSRKAISETGFKSLHYSAHFAMQKLFINQLEFQYKVNKVLLLDDDFTFFTDMSPLWDIIAANPNKISLYCPHDKDRVLHYFTRKNAPNNGDTLRYCNSGIMGIPLESLFQSSNFTHHAINAMRRMTNEYDFSYSVADQDVVNRMYAEDKDNFELIPCRWGCDVNSCAGTAPNRGKCNTCLDEKCLAFHWLNKRYEQNNGKKWGQPRFNFLHYYQLNSTELLNRVFIPRVQETC